MPKVDTYFVLNKLYNGEEGTFAKTTGGPGEQQPDGWYWLIDGMDDGKGPFNSKRDAERAGARETALLYYAFMPDKEPYMLSKAEYEDGDDANQGSAARVFTVQCGHYVIEVDQYYHSEGVLKLEITQPLDRALTTFSKLLAIDSALEDVVIKQILNR